jgi:acyl-homoserine lactone acylase PvdQ
VTAPAYPYYLTAEWVYGYRSQRIVDRIEELGGDITASQLTDLQRTRATATPRTSYRCW